MTTSFLLSLSSLSLSPLSPSDARVGGGPWRRGLFRVEHGASQQPNTSQRLLLRVGGLL